ncbi:sensor histidine kinase [Actinophytocola sp.]|jgi:two-component system LytT family sensor kinase|uniref:sensor histidine kinase n=1 Tax=Actinophytocola sp. TaxID=1872138 RepID=UPI0039C89FD4
MSVPADREPAVELARSWRGPWSRADPAAALAMARHIAADLRDGLAGTGVRAAARSVRRLLDADGVGLADLSGIPVWAGTQPAGDAAEILVRQVLHAETRAGRPPLMALPLHVQDELAGVLLVHGNARRALVKEAAALIVESLQRGRLEASAEQAAQAELRALRAEISPHFVYNALTVIASLVRSEPDRARDLMLDFADYIRYSLARHGEYTTVADEFHAIETYLALQRAVLGERLRVQVRVAPEVLAVALPYLVLQPLVENAVRHGIEPHVGPGLVQVRGEAEGNDCVISVEDDGVGMDPALAEGILAGRAASDGVQDGPTKVGLANVDRRLRTVYGPWYGLVAETAVGAGTRVVVRIPRFQPGVMP